MLHEAHEGKTVAARLQHGQVNPIMKSFVYSPTRCRRAAKSSLRPAFSHAVDLGYIESNPFDGTPYSCSFISHKFLKFFDEAGVKNKSFKTFRSTYATWLLNAGTSTMYIKNQLGHSTVRLLETQYAEFITEEFRGEVNNINVKRLTQK